MPSRTCRCWPRTFRLSWTRCTPPSWGTDGRPDPSRPPAERHFSVLGAFELVAGIVGEGVVFGAEEHAVGDGGVSAVGPGVWVVGVAHRWGPVAVFGAAALVAEHDREAL